MKVKAARYYGVKDVRVEEIKIPEPKENEVLIKVKYAGICGSDLHIFNKGMFVENPPITMGHEFVGEIEKAGSGIKHLKPKDLVFGDPRVSCGKCEWCKEDKLNLCPDLSFVGEVVPGAMAEYIVMAEDKVFLLPENLDMKQASLIEPLAVALHILTVNDLYKVDRLGIIGAGPIGLLTLVLAKKKFEINHVTVVDISRKRLDMAKELGADSTATRVEEVSSVDGAVEAVGIEKTLRDVLKWVLPGGKLVLSGVYEEEVTFDPNEIIAKELEIVGIHGYGTEDIEKTIEIITDHDLNLEPVITDILPLEEVKEGFLQLSKKDKKVGKVLLKMGGF